MLVEDEVALSRALVRALEGASFDVTPAYSGDRALDALLRGTFDLVVADVNLPSISGIDLLSMVRAYDLDVPVILMTGAPTIATAVQAVNLGAVQYLTKPFPNDELVAVCHRASRQRIVVRAAREREKPALVEAPLAVPALGDALDRALEHLWIAFQPIVDGRGVVAYEALMRSTEPLLPNPPAVLEAAEKLDRLTEVGRRVRDLVAVAIDDAPAGAMIFVNVHTADLLDPSLYKGESPLSRYAERVVLEVTERASIDHIDQLVPRVSMLRVLGFRVALDDLGAGYAGLSSFAQLEPDFVKLDMSLIRGIHQSTVRRRLVAAVAGLAKELEMQIVAEGVETAEETSCVMELGCGLFQGYYFARPSRGFSHAENLGRS